APTDRARDARMQPDPAAGQEEGGRYPAPAQRFQDPSGSAGRVAAAVEGEGDELAIRRQPLDLAETDGAARARRERQYGGGGDYSRRHPDSRSSRTSSTPVCQMRSISSSSRW